MHHAMYDRVSGGRLQQLRDGHGIEIRCARYYMCISSRKQDQVTGFQPDGRQPRYRGEAATLGNEMLVDEVLGIRHVCSAVAGTRSGEHAPRRRELRAEKHRPCEVDNTKHVGESIHMYPSGLCAQASVCVTIPFL